MPIHSDKVVHFKTIEKIEKKLLHYTGKAIANYQMIKKGDRILVAVSGGKDSMTLLLLLKHLQRRTHNKFTLKALTLDQGQPNWNDERLQAWFKLHEIDYAILRKDTYSIVIDKIPKHQTYCSLCSRLRRGILYRYAEEHEFNKIALGHHREDLITTLLMSILYGGTIKSMPPKLLSDNKKNIVIRPMVYCQEKDIAAYAKLKQFPIIPCNLCASQPNLTRVKLKRWIEHLADENKSIPSNILSALQKVQLSQLMDKTQWNFSELDEQQIR